MLKSMRVLLIGATGVVGTECVKHFNAAKEVSEVHLLVRRELPATLRLSKVREHIIDFEKIDKLDFPVDAFVSSLGTTIRTAGSQEEFRKVDHDYVIRIAKLAREAGARTCLLVSALGADPNSRVFYNRIKGEIERDLIAIGFESVTIVRPSVLLGDRKEVRVAESFAKELGKLLPKKWRSVEPKAIAAKLAEALAARKTGVTVLENAELHS